MFIPTAYGFLIDSHNFYTFNRKYYHFEGSCSYVLAQDYVDGNFSLIANLAGGKLKSVQLSDKQNSFEILADRSVSIRIMTFSLAGNLLFTHGCGSSSS